MTKLPKCCLASVRRATWWRKKKALLDSVWTLTTFAYLAAATTKKTIAILNLYDDTAHQHCTADEEELGGLLFIYHTLAP
eukprot:scaffold1467_cov147-Skeletonema_menzelii.AAC.12